MIALMGLNASRIGRRIPVVVLCLFLSQWARAESIPAAEPDSGFLEQYAATRRFQAGLPTEIHLTQSGDAVLFLRSGPRDFVQSIYEYDVAARRERVLLTAEKILRGAQENLSVEERARRERMRISSRGIVSYRLSRDGRRILVPLAERLFLIERESGATKELVGGAGFPIDPQLSPDGTKVACVRNGDLHVLDVDSGRESRLTQGATETLRHGEPEFVAQEEMDRNSGYWWSPDSRRIAYQETDASQVEEFHILDPAHPERPPDAWRYPRPGKNNARVRLGVLSATGGPTTWVRWDRDRYPYLATVRWSENAPLTILVQNRRQTEEALLAVDASSGGTRTLLVERDRAWLNLDQEMPRWTKDGRAFLWTTERRGNWQLELHRADGKLLRALTSPGFRMRGFVDLDETGRRAWITGGEDPTQVHLFRVSLDARDATPEQVSREPGLHGAEFAENGATWVHTTRGLEREPTYEVRDREGRAIGNLHSVAETPRIRPHLSFETVGARQYRALVVRPDGFHPGDRYPVLVSVYGGPLSQTVTRSWQGHLIEQWLADHGYVVVSIDGRGTPGRGRAWERAIKGDLIEVPLADQVEALRALGARFPEMDLSRVGIYGWSFGGYFSAMAVLRHPELFRAGVAGAPVVEWRDYDTHYTERYMDLPQSNPRGYEAASVLTYVPRLERPLLIVHGTMDDNVYFLHSIKLCEALFRAGKDFEFLPLAGFTHLVPEPLVTARLNHRIESFFEKHLGAANGKASAEAGVGER